MLEERPLFASSTGDEQPRRPGGMSLWFAAAASLVLGIVIGFASGYRAGQGAADVPGSEQTGAGSAPTSGATPGQTFSESTVGDPVRIEDEPIVAAPEGAADSAGRVPPEIRSSGGGPAVTTPAPRAGGSGPAATAPAPRAGGGAADVRPETRTGRGDPAVAAPGPGSIQVLSRPSGAQVTLDGRPIGTTPMLIPDVAAGSHTIRLELGGFNPWTTTVDVRGAGPTRVAASLEQP